MTKCQIICSILGHFKQSKTPNSIKNNGKVCCKFWQKLNKPSKRTCHNKLKDKTKCKEDFVITVLSSSPILHQGLRYSTKLFVFSNQGLKIVLLFSRTYLTAVSTSSVKAPVATRSTSSARAKSELPRRWKVIFTYLLVQSQNRNQIG